MNDRTPHEIAKEKHNRKDLTLFLLFLLAFLAVLFVFIPSWIDSGQSKNDLPVSLHSSREADYTRDHEGNLIPGISLRIIRDILQDQGYDQNAIDYRIATLTAVLLSPVPTATGTYAHSITNTPTPIPTHTPTPVPSATPQPSPTQVVIPAQSQVPQPTKTSVVEPPQPGLLIQKSLASYDDNDLTGSITLGDDFWYRFLISNVGNTQLSFVSTRDLSFNIPITCPQAILSAGATMSCTADAFHRVTLAEANAGQVVNQALVTGDYGGVRYSDMDKLVVQVGQTPSIKIIKTVSAFDDNDSSGAISAGDGIWYQFDVSNMGNVTLTSISVTDNTFTLSVNCPVTSLNPGASTTCNTTSAHIITAANILTGQLVNTATANAIFNGATISDSDTLVVPLSIQVVKSLASYTDNDGSGTITLGDSLFYQFTVTNIGPAALNSIAVTDDTFGFLVSCPFSTLASGSSMTCTASLSHTVTLAEADAGVVINTASVTGQPIIGPIVSDSDTLDTPILQNPNLSISKTSSLATFNSVGQVINYTFLVTNTGNVTITGPISVDDDHTTNEACPAGNLAPAAFITCTASYTTTQTDLDTGSVMNSAFATGAGPGGVTVASATDSVTVTAIQNPSIQIIKIAASYADNDSSGTLTLGDDLSYRFDVTNTGNVTLNSVSVTDDSFGIPVTCPSTSLAPGATMLCTADNGHTITVAESDAGQVTNTASVTGLSGSTLASDSDSISTPVSQNPGIQLVISLQSYADNDSSGSITLNDGLLYQFTITNTGNVTLTNLNVIDTTFSIPISCPVSALDPAASTDCTATASHVVTLAEADAGQVVNTATARGDFNASTYTASNSLLTAISQNPALTLTKAGNPSTYSAVGQVITYTYTIQNTGNVTLSDQFSITDNKLGTVDPCGSGPLAPGATTTCSGAYSITQYDLDFGSLTNLATANTTYGGSPFVSNTDSVTATAIQSPSYAIGKSATDVGGDGPGGHADQPGDVISYQIILLNTGNVSLIGVSVSDPLLDPLSGPVESGAADGILYVGETWTYSGTYTVTQTDIETNGGGDGDIDNTASATTTYLPTPQYASTAVPIDQLPGLSLSKSADLASYNAVGQVITYTYTIQNSGNVTLSGPFSITDDRQGTLTDCATGPLAPAASTTCTSTHTVTQADLDAGSITNTATASGNSLTSAPSSVTLNAVQSPAIQVVKSSTTSDVTAAGQVVPYNFAITNVGNITLSGITTADPFCDSAPTYQSGDIDTDNLLDLSETWIYSCLHTVAQTEMDSGGNLSNTVTADSTESAADTDTLNIPITQNPTLTVDKSSLTFSLSAPGIVTYDYLVTNTGNITITGISLADDNDNNDMNCPANTLAVGASMSCTATHTFTQAELDAGGSLTNNVIASSNEAPNALDSLNIPIAQTPAIQVVKNSTTADVTFTGQVVPYDFTVINVGNITLSGISVTDPNCDSAPTYQSGDTDIDTLLDLTETWMYSCVHTVTQAELDAGGSIFNTVTANSNESGPATDTHNIPITQSPSLSLTKSADLASYNAVGQVITYTYTIQNSGNVSLSGPFSITDDRQGTLTDCATGPLAPSASTTCSSTHTVTQADLDAGSITNTATASGNSLTSAPSSVTLNAVQSPAIQISKSLAYYDDNDVSGTISNGDGLWYQFSITNDGNVILTNVAVIDETFAIAVTCPATALAPSNTILCTANVAHIVTYDEAVAGHVSNTATATGELSGTPYSASHTLDTPVFSSNIPSSISGQVRDDTDSDGDLGDGDSGLSNVKVELYNGLCTLGVSCPSALTDSNGIFTFLSVSNGSYMLVETDLPQYISTADSDPPNDNRIDVIVSAGASSTNNVFLDKVNPTACTAPLPITGFVTSSVPTNGQTGVPIGKATLSVTFNQPMKTSGGGSVLDKGQFDNSIKNLTLGGDVPILGITYDAATQTATLSIDTSDPQWAPGSQFRIRVKGGLQNGCGTKQDIDVDILFTTESTISGQVRNSLDGNGIYGVTIALTSVSCGGTCATTTTNLNGNFSFFGFAPGNYTLVETDLPGYTSVSDSNGTNDNQIALTLSAGSNSTGHFFVDTPATCVTPSISSTNPANGATGVPLSTTTLTVTFSQPMITYGGGSVLDIGNFDNNIDNLSLGGDVPILSVNYNPSTYTAILTIDTSDPQWQAGSQFRLRIKSGLKNPCGANLGNDVDVLFTTQAYISGQVRNSLDNQGIYGVPILLTGASCGGTCATTFTDLNGNFRFSGYTPGNYTILETNLPGYSGAIDSALPNDDQIPFTLVAGSNSTGHYFIDIPTCAGGANFVASTVPANAATGVSLSTSALTVTFNQPMITYGGGSVFDIGNFDNNIDNLTLGGDVPILSISYNPATYTATLLIDTSDPQWKPGSQFRLRIRDSIKNACDGRPTANLDIFFTTDLIVSGQVRNDLDGNGNLSDPDPGIADVTVRLYNSTNTLIGTTTTSAGGFFTFNSLLPGTYYVRETDPSGYISTADSFGANDNEITVNISAGVHSIGHLFLDYSNLPGITIGNFSAFEKNSGVSTYQFVVSLSKSSTSTITVNYTTVNGTAIGGANCTAGVDYRTNSGVVTFLPGELTKNTNITVCTDSDPESDETFTVVLSAPSNAFIAKSTGTGIIFDDDSAGFSTGHFVQSISPADLSTNVPRSTNIVIEFNRDMCESTVIDPNNVRLYPTGGGSDVTGTRTYNPVTRTVMLVPSAPLNANTLYTIQVRFTKTLVDGCNLSSSPITTEFTTGSSLTQTPSIVEKIAGWFDYVNKYTSIGFNN